MGVHFISITLTDDNVIGALSTLYSITIVVTEAPIDEGPPFVVDARFGQISDLTNTGELVLSFTEDVDTDVLI